MLTQHLNDPSARASLARLLNNLRLHILAILGTRPILCGNQQILADFIVLGDQITDTVVIDIAPYQHLGIVLKHLDHRGFASAPMIQPRDPHHRPVTIKQLAHLAIVQVQVLRTIVWTEETVTVAMATDTPRQ